MLVFLHIQKTAGTSFGAALADLCAARPCPFMTDEHLQQGACGLADYGLLHGHFTFHAVAKYLPGAEIVTMLRHPVARAISQYQSWHDFPVDENWQSRVEQDKTAAAVLEFTKAADVHEFFGSDWAPIARQFTNYQTYILSGLHTRSTTFKVWEPSVLQSAKDNLRSTKLFGLAERMDQSIALAHSLIGAGASVPLSSVSNRSRYRSDEWRDADVVRRIESCSPMDLELYAWAREEFDREVDRLGLSRGGSAPSVRSESQDNT